MSRRLVFAALLASASAAEAALITVTTTSVGTGGPGCTIRDAVTAANVDAATGGCAAGGGPDVIELPTGATFAFTAPDGPADPLGAAALPFVNGNLAIEGNGATLLRAAAPACTIDSNPAPDEFRILRITSGDVVLRNLTIRGGCADAMMFPVSGGGILGGTGALTLDRVVVADNVASSGGGISASGALTITTSHVDANRSNGGGAGISVGGMLVMSDSTVSNNVNTAPVPGGGIAISAPFLPGPPIVSRIRNSTISGNSALDASAVLLSFSSTVELSHVTIASNTGGSAISSQPFPGVTPTVNARSLWLGNNTPANCPPAGPFAPAFVREGTNLSTDASCAGFTGIPVGALEPLADNGGFAPTHRPVAGSAALDAAPGCFAFGGVDVLATDQRGRTRPRDGNGDGSAVCDVGAVELDPGAAPVITAPASATTLSDQVLLFGASFGNAITLADADAGALPVQLELSVSQGTLSLASVAGLTFAIGDGTNDTTMRFQGSLASIAVALDGLAYIPFAGYTGPDTLALVANDLGNSGEGGAQTGTANVALTVAVRAAIASLAPSGVAFGGRSVDAGPSAPRAIVLTNTGNIPLTGIVFKISPSDYALTHDCPPSQTLAPTATCTLMVTFDPTAGGSRLGVLAVLSNSTTSPDGVVLTGAGLADLVFANGYE